jgi:hypothetical protein
MMISAVTRAPARALQIAANSSEGARRRACRIFARATLATAKAGPKLAPSNTCGVRGSDTKTIIGYAKQARKPEAMPILVQLASSSSREIPVSPFSTRMILLLFVFSQGSAQRSASGAGERQRSESPACGGWAAFGLDNCIGSSRSKLT